MWLNRKPNIATVSSLCALLLVSLLTACGGGTSSTPTPNPTPSTVTLDGAIGIIETQKISFGIRSLAVPRELGVEGLNRVIRAATKTDGLSIQSVSSPIRGLNAAVLSGYLGTQEEQKPLFGLDTYSILAVDSHGTVISEAPIHDDGTWSVVIKTNLWSEAETIGLVQAYEYDNGTSDPSDDYWVCTKPLEYEISSGKTVPALFNYGSAASSLNLLSTKSVGLFNYHQNSANPASPEERTDLAPVADPDFSSDTNNDGTADYLTCGNADALVFAPVTADFDWEVPGNLEEHFLYDYGISFGLDTTDASNPQFVSAAALDADGTMWMEVTKPRSVSQPMALVMSDVSFYDESKFGMPLTPTFDLNAALGAGDIQVGDEGYDYGVLSGGMAYIEGYVTDSAGYPVEGALIVGVLDSEEILDFNIAISEADGLYQLLLPATSPDLAYYIVAMNADGTEVGLPTGLPWFSNDPNDLRYSITEVTAYTSADIEIFPAE